MDKGQHIKALRTQKGLTQEDLAAKTDISVRTIQRIEAGEVEPRSYTLMAIAAALGVDFEALQPGSDEEKISPEEKYWLPLLHLSGLFVLLFPPVIIWISKMDSVKGVREHGADVINFQLTLLLIIIPLALTAFLVITIPVLIFFGIYSTVIILINTVKVYNRQPYHYPLSIKILKPKSALTQAH